MPNQTYRGACVSDIHLFHDRTPTAKIVSELRAAFIDDPATHKLNTVYIAGDLFDRVVHYPSAETLDAENFFVDWLRHCKKHQTQIRILEGTPSHDWKQSQRLVHLNEVADIHADLKYFQDVTVEYNEVYDLHVLYVPDEYDPDPNVTLQVVRERIQAAGIEQVDLAIMHGQFHYQLPPQAKAPKHDEEAYLALTKYFIFIGHVHMYSQMDRIVAQGSFSRLCHGDEIPKGHVRFSIDPTGSTQCRFIENESATIYKTVDVRGLDLDSVMQYVAEEIKSLPALSHVRLHADKGDTILIQQNYDQLMLSHLRLNWSKPKVDTPEAEALRHPDQDVLDYVAITLTPENIERQIHDRLDKGQYEPTLVERAKLRLKESLTQ